MSDLGKDNQVRNDVDPQDSVNADMTEEVEVSVYHRELRSPVEINWHVPNTIISRYATNMLIQGTANEFILSFFEIPPPIVFSQVDEEKLGAVQAECIARIIIARDRFPEFLRVMQAQALRHKPRQEGDE